MPRQRRIMAIRPTGAFESCPQGEPQSGLDLVSRRTAGDHLKSGAADCMEVFDQGSTLTGGEHVAQGVGEHCGATGFL